jgi:hypothetical protein
MKHIFFLYLKQFLITRRIRRVSRLLIVVKYGIIEFLTGVPNKMITQGEATYFGDGFATKHFSEFLNEDGFANAYKDAFNLIDDPAIDPKKTDIRYRAHICTWAANQAINLDGDFVEFGTWYGILPLTICNYLDFNNTNKRFYLFDTWENTESIDPNYRKDVYATVKNRFAKYKSVVLVRGLLPDTLKLLRVKEISYCSIDLNGYLVERAILELVYDKIVSGGIIYFDDYGFNYPLLRETIEEFFLDKPETILKFASGPAIVVKI